MILHASRITQNMQCHDGSLAGEVCPHLGTGDGFVKGREVRRRSGGHDAEGRRKQTEARGWEH